LLGFSGIFGSFRSFYEFLGISAKNLQITLKKYLKIQKNPHEKTQIGFSGFSARFSTVFYGF
jgi:hypothetical protein